jgi:hypothetical protein
MIHADPIAIVLLAKPVVLTDANHQTAEFPFPALAVRAVWREELAVDVGNAGHTSDRGIAAVGGQLSVSGDGDV